MAGERTMTLVQAKRRIAELEGILRDTLWMARRYAHGRQSYAVGMFNDAARKACDMGVVVDQTDGSIFAIDGSLSPQMCGLSAGEFEEACESLNKVNITPTRCWFAAGPTELCDHPAIYRDDPAGGDPYVIIVARRILRPDALYELCELANEAIDARAARPAPSSTETAA